MSDIYLYGSIGESFFGLDDSITAKSVMDQLAEVDGDVTVHISSGGGDVYCGIDVMNALREHPGQVTVIVESLAASAASFIAVGGADRVLMRDSSELMIHKAWTFADGNADEIRRTLSDLDRQDMKLAKIYADKAGGSVDEWLDRMGEETWYTAQEAVDAGLADGLVEAKASQPEVANAVRRRFRFQNRAAAPPPPVASRSESAVGHNERGDTVGILNQLADELGKSPGDVKKALAGFFNEEVTVTATVDITYPEVSRVAPTGKITIHPEGDAPAGIVFTAGEAPEGWAVEVEETTGVATVTAPAMVEPGATVDIPVNVAGSEGSTPTELSVHVEVKSASEESEEPAVTPPGETEPGADGDVVQVPRAYFDVLTAAYQANSEQVEEMTARKREETVDQWIAEGRFVAALRSQAIDAMATDEAAARKVWGGLPKGKINRAEKGYSASKVADTVTSESTKQDRLAGWIAKANERANAQNKGA